MKKILFFFISCSCFAVASPGLFLHEGFAFYQEHKPESDSAIIAQHIHEVKVDYALEEFSDHSFNSHVDDTGLDSILRDMRVRIENPEMHYAPDSSFKIFTVEIVSCGGYCNSEWRSWLHFNDGSGLVISNIHFDAITGIHLLPDGKYLIGEHSYGRSGTFSCGTYLLTLVSFSDYKMITHPIADHQPVEPDGVSADSVLALAVSQCSYINSDFWLTFDPVKQQLSYQYADDIIPWATPDSISVHSGVYSYEHGQFARKESKSSKVKFEGD